MNKLPKAIFTDIDGVWTDGGMYYDNFGNEIKKFSTSDSAGVLYAKELNIPIIIITGEDTEIVKRRASKLNIDYTFQGIKNKIECALDICDRLKISLADATYIGDDINDIPLLRSVGFSACPFNAPNYIKDMVDYVTIKKGGDGAFREFVEYILQSNNCLQKVINQVVAKHEMPH